MKKATYLNLLVVFVVLVCIGSISAQRADASGFSLSVNPTLFTIHAFPKTSTRNALHIQNKGNEPVELQIALKPFTASSRENGEVAYIQNQNGADSKVLGKIRILEGDTPVSGLTLEPKQGKDLTLAIDLPEDEPSSDYYFSILFVSLPPPSQQAQKTPASPSEAGRATLSQISEGIATNVLLSIGPSASAKGVLREFSTPFFQEKGPISFTIRVENSGDSLFTPTGNILIKNIFGQPAGNVTLNPSNVLKGSTRLIPSGPGLTRAVWQKQFILGLYSAELEVALSPHGPVFNEEIQFITFPFKTTALFILLLYFTLKIRDRLKKRLGN